MCVGYWEMANLLVGPLLYTPHRPPGTHYLNNHKRNGNSRNADCSLGSSFALFWLQRCLSAWVPESHSRLLVSSSHTCTCWFLCWRGAWNCCIHFLNIVRSFRDWLWNCLCCLSWTGETTTANHMWLATLHQSSESGLDSIFQSERRTLSKRCFNFQRNKAVSPCSPSTHCDFYGTWGSPGSSAYKTEITRTLLVAAVWLPGPVNSLYMHSLPV